MKILTTTTTTKSIKITTTIIIIIIIIKTLGCSEDSAIQKVFEKKFGRISSNPKMWHSVIII